MSRNVSRITLSLVACLLGAAFVYGQNFGQPTQPPQVAQPPQAAGGVFSGGGGGADNYFSYFGGPQYPPDPRGHKLNQEEHELAQQAAELTRQLGEAENTGDRDKLKTQLGELLGKQFDVQRQRREQEIAQIEERVGKLREQLKKRSDARQTIIDRRLEQIVSDADGLGWNGADGGGGGGFGGFSAFGGAGLAPRATVVGPGGRGIAPAPVPFRQGHPTAPRRPRPRRRRRTLQPTRRRPSVGSARRRSRTCPQVTNV